MKPLVYVAAPYRTPDPVENTHNAIKVCDQLAMEGIVTPICPHLTLLFHVVTPHPEQFWLDYDLEVMAHCHAVLRLPGQSSGADAEVIAARKALQPVFYEVPDLYDWARGYSISRTIRAREDHL
jgi:hypothetical protein